MCLCVCMCVCVCVCVCAHSPSDIWLASSTYILSQSEFHTPVEAAEQRRRADRPALSAPLRPLETDTRARARAHTHAYTHTNTQRILLLSIPVLTGWKM